MSETTFFPEKTTLVLSNYDNAWLDEVAVDIRQRTGAPVSRSGLVRAIILAVCEASVDLSDCGSEDAVYKRILARLNAGRR